MFGNDDYLIRAYGNCPAFLKNTPDWFKSQEFALKEAEVAGLLQLLSRNLKQNVTLTDFYNIYDDVRVLKLVAFAFAAHCNFGVITCQQYAIQNLPQHLGQICSNKSYEYFG